VINVPLSAQTEPRLELLYTFFILKYLSSFIFISILIIHHIKKIKVIRKLKYIFNLYYIINYIIFNFF
jgi:hypothetical protein